MAPAGFEHGSIGSELLMRLRQFVKANDLGVVVGADTGFVLARDPDLVRSPDVAFVTKHRVAQATIKAFFPGAPDLAVEVLSPSDTIYELGEKIDDFFAAGTRMVWVINPKSKTAGVHRPGLSVEVLHVNDQLSGLDVVPGFECRVGDLFE